MKQTFLLSLCIQLSYLIFAQTTPWRSEYYQENWTPPTNKNFYNDAFLQDFSYAGYHRGEKAIPSPIGNTYDVTKAPYNA